MHRMQLPRAAVRAIGRVLIGVLLGTQFAVASYACPGLAQQIAAVARSAADGAQAAERNAAVEVQAAAPAQQPAEAAATGNPCAHLDPDAANLCIEHCRFGQQSVDTTPLPAVHAAVPTLLYALPLQPTQVITARGRPSPARAAGVAAAPPPPHAILHCVYRI
jgi:hypothetical protein